MTTDSNCLKLDLFELGYASRTLDYYLHEAWFTHPDQLWDRLGVCPVLPDQRLPFRARNHQGYLREIFSRLAGSSLGEDASNILRKTIKGLDVAWEVYTHRWEELLQMYDEHSPSWREMWEHNVAPWHWKEWGEYHKCLEEFAEVVEDELQGWLTLGTVIAQVKFPMESWFFPGICEGQPLYRLPEILREIRKREPTCHDLDLDVLPILGNDEASEDTLAEKLEAIRSEIRTRLARNGIDDSSSAISLPVPVNESGGDVVPGESDTTPPSSPGDRSEEQDAPDVKDWNPETWEKIEAAAEGKPVRLRLNRRSTTQRGASVRED